MYRRHALRLAAGALGGLAGCANSGESTAGDATPAVTRNPADTKTTHSPSTVSARPSPTVRTDAGPDTVAGAPLPVPRSQLRRSVPRDAIPAITDPAFGRDWSGVELSVREPYQAGTPRAIRPRLSDDDSVIGVQRGDDARAYPLRVLDWHETVNDDFDGPLLVTYCPLCRSGIVAERRVRGRETVFGVSGQLWMANLVMYDRLTDSYWSQMAATAIRGPETGTTLSLVPSTITTWGDWRGRYPRTRVLLPPPESNTVKGRNEVRDYTFDPYAGSAPHRQRAPTRSSSDPLHPKALVMGVNSNGESRAYPFWIVSDAGAVNDTVGDRPVVVAAAPGETLVAYDRRVGGETLQFEPDGGSHLRAGGSRWRRVDGQAVDGPHAGTRLEPAADSPPIFWFAWIDFHPDTTIYFGADRSRATPASV